MPKTKTPKSKKMFKAVRGSYLPNNWLGWLTYLPFIAYLVFTFVYAWSDTSKTSQAIMFMLPNWVAATAVMTWVAKRNS